MEIKESDQMEMEQNMAMYTQNNPSYDNPNQ